MGDIPEGEHRLQNGTQIKVETINCSIFWLLLILFLNVILCTTEWVLWEHKAAGGGAKSSNQWKENMSELCHIRTVEDFWRNFNHIPKPSEVFFDGESRKKVGPTAKTVEEYSLFKKGIEPEWGDPANIVGGEWFCRQSFEPELLDLYWMNLAMSVIGETMETDSPEDTVNGVRVVDKSRGQYPMFKLELWVRTRRPGDKDRLLKRLQEIIKDGQHPRFKLQPKFEWKDHS
jgi:hypothetical protein